MSGWAIVAIVAILMSGMVRIFTARNHSRHGIITDKDGNPMPQLHRDDREARREIEDLRERIKVIERIVTDGSTLDASETRRISREIEALRETDALRDRQDG